MNAALILQLLNMIQAGFNWLAARGVARERAIALLDQANAENRDVTSAEVQAELDQLQAELDETAEAIDRLNE